MCVCVFVCVSLSIPLSLLSTCVRTFQQQDQRRRHSHQRSYVPCGPFSPLPVPSRNPLLPRSEIVSNVKLIASTAFRTNWKSRGLVTAVSVCMCFFLSVCYSCLRVCVNANMHAECKLGNALFSTNIHRRHRHYHHPAFLLWKMEVYVRSDSVSFPS